MTQSGIKIVGFLKDSTTMVTTASLVPLVKLSHLLGAPVERWTRPSEDR